MKVITSSLLFLLLFGCSDSVAFESVEPDVIRVELNPRLNVDDNGFYHLELGESWQTLHRVSGTAYINDVPLEVLRVNWESSHYWYLGDTLGYIVNRGLTDDLIYVSYDTTYITGFDGMEVPTVKCKPSGREIFLKDGNEQKFYLRTGPSTIELTGHEMQQFISQRFRNN